MEEISIITICRNNLSELINTCNSVDEQEILPFEHFIVDGSVNNEIKEWLAEPFQPKYRKSISELDYGISDAFNKGIKYSKANIILLLNSGDCLYDKSVLKIVNTTFLTHPEIKWAHGLLHIYRGGFWVNIGKPFEKEKLYRGMRSTFHPTMYVKREIYEKYGLYDLTIKIAMDYDFLCRISNEKFKFINYPLAKFDPSGISSSKYVDATLESAKCFQKYFGTSIKQKIWLYRQLFLHSLINSKLGYFLYSIKVKLKLENI